MAGTSSGTAVVTFPSDTQILITREFAAPRHLVYRAYTDPELIRRWWSGDQGRSPWPRWTCGSAAAGATCSARTGGSEVAFHGEYREIVAAVTGVVLTTTLVR